METKEILNEFAKTLLEGVQQAGAFVNEQLPLVLNEYIMWGIWGSVLNAAALLLGSYLSFRLFKWGKAAFDNSDDELQHFLAVFCGGGASAILLLSAISYLSIALKAIIAPRVYLIEELSKLVQ